MKAAGRSVGSVLGPHTFSKLRSSFIAKHYRLQLYEATTHSGSGRGHERNADYIVSTAQERYFIPSFFIDGAAASLGLTWLASSMPLQHKSL